MTMVKMIAAPPVAQLVIPERKRFVKFGSEKRNWPRKTLVLKKIGSQLSVNKTSREPCIINV